MPPRAARENAAAPAAGPRMMPSEAAWREAWVGAGFAGAVGIAEDKVTGEEHLVIRCREVLAKYGEDARIIDDGRTVGVAVDDHVAFGVVPRPGKAPIAVNVWRMPKKQRLAEPRKGATRPGSFGTVPQSLSENLTGMVRHQSPKSGDYFITCPSVFQHYGMDPKILLDDMPAGVGVGDAIVFTIEAPLHEMTGPTAKNVTRATGAAAEAIMASTAKGKGGKGGKGGAKGGKGGKGGGGKSQSKAPRRRTEATMRMVGIVKKKSPSSGRHFVLCQDISDVYGRDAQVPVEEEPEGCLCIGDRIAFDVEEPGEGYQGIPFALHVRVVNRVGAGNKRKAAELGGDGEDEEDVQLDDGDGEEDGAGEEILEEPALDEEELQEMEAEEQRERAAAERKPAVPKVAAAPSRKKTTAVPDPQTPEEWAALQDRLFPGMPALKPGWIRIRSKSKGLVYYYNMDSGESSAAEPLR